MGVLLQIRNVPEETRSALKERAARRGESLNTYLLHLLANDVATPTADEIFERAAKLGGVKPGKSSAEIIREEREARDAELMRRIHA